VASAKEFRLLAVDDDKSITTFLQAALSKRFEVVTTNDPEDALRLAAEISPDLILSDVNMPILNGFELCRRLKASEATRNIPIIVLTSTIDAQSEWRAFDAGAVDFVLKGVDLAALEVRIATRIARRRALSELENQAQALETLVTQRTADLEASRKALRESMHNLRTTRVSTGVYWIQVPEADLYVLCGAPADVVKHMMLRGYIAQETKGGIDCETGPNVILLSDVMVQNGGIANLSEFPVLQMLYRQGMILPGHPNNIGRKPMLIGSEAQVRAQLDYIYRGNYGLVSEEELQAAGLSDEEARRQMSIKLGFAFGKIRASDELLDYRFVTDEPVEISSGVSVKRLASNRYEFRYRDVVSEVDLNLKPGEAYESPYSPGHQLVDRQYFGVIHCGEGDGWDMRRQSMSSIVMFQGRYYLVDAGPSVLDTLLRLGIDISEITGIFHTHAHDDHFAGLPSLILSGHKLKYYATPLVRHSVTKKLAALMSIDEDLFPKFFEVIDLAEGEWNDCGGMEVLPIYSPHPVENNIFVFRAMDDDGYKSYAHWADIVSLDVLEKMLETGMTKDALPGNFIERVRSRYLMPASIKKLDAGGGLIHGQPLDFSSDQSEKIILAHRAGRFSSEELEIGSQASFGAVDVLINTSQDYLRQRAYRFLSELIPNATADKLNTLMRASIETFNAGSIILRKGVINDKIYLLLSGTVEYSHPDFETPFSQATGALMGAQTMFDEVPLVASWRAMSSVRLMGIGVKTLKAFLQSMDWYEGARIRLGDVDFLQRTWLFGDRVSSGKHGTLALGKRLIHLDAGEPLPSVNPAFLYMVHSGELHLTVADRQEPETLVPGDVFGEDALLGLKPLDYIISATQPSTLMTFKDPDISNMPIVLWKLREIYDRRRVISA
jgi:hemerythrin